MNSKDWEIVKERIDEYDKANAWEHLDKFDNSHECENEQEGNADEQDVRII